MCGVYSCLIFVGVIDIVGMSFLLWRTYYCSNVLIRVCIDLSTVLLVNVNVVLVYKIFMIVHVYRLIVNYE